MIIPHNEVILYNLERTLPKTNKGIIPNRNTYDEPREDSFLNGEPYGTFPPYTRPDGYRTP